MNPINITTHEETELGPYIGTVSGSIFHPFNPQINEVEITDIAHALSMKCRWGGHCDYFFSVAQHCLEVYRYVKNNGGTVLEQMQALMHDAAEAYCVDMPTPIKKGLPSFVEMENKISEVIASKYNYEPEMSPLVHDADKRCLYIEALNLFKCVPAWIYSLDPDILCTAHARQFPIPMSPCQARDAFLAVFETLEGKIDLGIEE